MAEAKAEKAAVPAVKKVRVASTLGFFIDLNTNTRIGTSPVEVVLTDWLQANIDLGLLKVCS